MFVPRRILEEKLLKLLAEDVGQGDATSSAIIPQGLETTAEVIANANGVVAGIEEATILAEALGLKVNAAVTDGSTIKSGQAFMKIQGDAKTILAVERTLLNVISRMSGIATVTRDLTEKLRKAKLPSKIAATRKTAPGLLFFDKKAVVIGGGDAHRMHLDDMILIKDNHIALAGSLEEAINRAKQHVSFSTKIEVEVENPQDALKAAELGADIVMLDNFSPQQAKEAVTLLKKSGFFRRVLLEASGGITPENLLEFASAGVDIISLGELTHSVKALDLSLEIAKA